MTLPRRYAYMWMRPVRSHPWSRRFDTVGWYRLAWFRDRRYEPVVSRQDTHDCSRERSVPVVVLGFPRLAEHIDAFLEHAITEVRRNEE